MSQTNKEGFVSLTDLVDFTPRQDEAFKSMFKHTFTLYGGARGGGKAVKVDTPIPTPDGWIRIVDLKAGDKVFGSDGKVCTVQWRSEPEYEKTYDLYFSDGSVIRASASHQWVTETKDDRVKSMRRTDDYRSKRRASRQKRGIGKRPDLALRNSTQRYAYLNKPVLGVRTTQEIVDTLTVGNKGEHNHAVLTCEPLELPDANLPIDPYVLGAWLGDGTSTSGDITGIDREIFDEIEKSGYVVSIRKDNNNFGILKLKTQLRDIGVLSNKHIPIEYLRASLPQRLALLQGLMDTDGTVDERGHCSFTNTNKQLVDGVYELIVSLGIKTTVRESRAKLYGKDCGAVYDMCFMTNLPVFRLPRKLARQKMDDFNGVHKRRYIVDAVKVEPQLMCCISVDSPDNTYLAGRSMIPTHNSYWLRWAMLSWILYQAKMGFPGIVGGLFSSTYTNLKDRQISKIASEFPSWLGVLKENKTLGLAFYLDKKFGGGALTLRNLDESTKYKSAEFGIIGVDELTEHTVDTFNILIGSLRWAGLKKPCFIAGSNPDGIGNDWVKNYFIHHVYPPELEPLSSEFNFVPALPTDNPHLDSSYYLMLNSLPDDLKRAWLLGDWDVFKGLAFKTFNKRTHVIDPIDIPDYWTRLIGIDSGYRAPFCALFGARNPDNGRVIIYKEIYETELTDRQQARKILDMSDDFEKKALRFADPAMWTRKTQEFITSSAQIYAQNGVPLRKGNNDRLDGKRKVDRLLNPMEDGLPGLLIFNTCPNLVKQLSQLVYDKYHTEDVDTRMEDHAYDALKYLLTSVRDYRAPQPSKYTKSPFLNLEHI